MSELSVEDDQAVNRLSFFMLAEAYRAMAEVMAKASPQAAQTLFLGLEELITATVTRIHEQQSEGTNSTSVAVAVGTRLAGVLEQAQIAFQAIEEDAPLMTAEAVATRMKIHHHAYDALSAIKERQAA